MNCFLLWDIDSTLLSANKISREVVVACVSEVLGREIQDDGSVQLAGATDPHVIRQFLINAGCDPSQLPALMKKAMRLMGPKFAERRSEYRGEAHVLGGVHEILKALADTRAVPTILSGNIAMNAVAKLDAFGLASAFDMEVGAYGNDAEDRNELVDIARERAGNKRCLYFEDHEVWVIGDSTKDFITARENGVRSMLVATGAESFETLARLDADVIVQDLTDTALLISAFENS